jgi:hypothetical protein
MIPTVAAAARKGPASGGSGLQRRRGEGLWAGTIGGPAASLSIYAFVDIDLETVRNTV